MGRAPEWAFLTYDEKTEASQTPTDNLDTVNEIKVIKEENSPSTLEEPVAEEPSPYVLAEFLLK